MNLQIDSNHQAKIDQKNEQAEEPLCLLGNYDFKKIQ